MAYLTVNNIDLSQYTKGLVVKKKYNYNAQTNAAGNTIVDIINSKTNGKFAETTHSTKCQNTKNSKPLKN